MAANTSYFFDLGVAQAASFFLEMNGTSVSTAYTGGEAYHTSLNGTTTDPRHRRPRVYCFHDGNPRALHLRHAGRRRWDVGALSPPEGEGVDAFEVLLRKPLRKTAEAFVWSIARSPLILGANMNRLDEATLALLTNDEILAVNQASEGNR